ncbi:pyruvate oxidase [Paenactinomyces guangxiensis]|uniref:Pyruvate oxidase n=1 Tax=Paenactinomyces guangxiensis TaxID=1490290 RepID=A0A7W1WSV7_9BACL|nr:pyruvate oxidase [Paenactinomyces guangxiensis]MBA4495427.1 pyruvate oxidase [Paenactinomyces guangxiensis]MBH8592452.1 pyruvate oxidase [Paenactinomyces guangxiensis]
MFRKTAGELLIDLLIEWGVDHIYGMPGDSINSIIEPLRKVQDKIIFIQVRHEEAGALAAASYAKLTGKLGVCMAIAGPGAIHLLNGLYDAKLDRAPILAITGQVESDLIGIDYFQEVKLERMFDDVAVYNQRIMSAEQLPGVVNQAIRTAYTRQGVSVLTIPDDIPKFEVEGNARRTTSFFVKPEVFPPEDDLLKAKQILSEAKKPVILAGKGAREARESLLSFADKIASPIALSLPGKGIIPDEHPFCIGGLGLIGTKPASEAMEEADTLIMIGTSFPFTGFLPEKAKTIQIDTDPNQIGKRVPVDAGLAGDAKKTLDWLTTRLVRQADRSFLEDYQQLMKKWWEKLKKQEEDPSTPIKPQRVVQSLQKVVRDNAILSVDVGNVTVWMARHFRMTNQKFVISSWLATLGCGLPGAIAGKIAYPDKQVFAICGDGGFGMTMNDFVTAVKYRLPIIVVVFNNHKIAMIKFEQEVMGNVEFGTELQNPNFAQYAEACGGVGYRVERPEELMPALEKAVSQTKPCIIDVVVDANEAPMPAKITFGQAAGYAKHMIKELWEEGKVDLPI